MKISAFFSHNNSREKEAKLNKDHSANSMSLGKYKKTSKYDSNIYRTKTIKNFDLIQEENNKEKLKRKLSKKILFKKDKVVPENNQSHFSNCNSQQQITAKASRRLELERKIFMMLSKDKLWKKVTPPSYKRMIFILMEALFVQIW